jgi:hypothetical protein
MYAAEHVCCAQSFLVHLVLLLLFGLLLTTPLYFCCAADYGEETEGLNVLQDYLKSR